MKTKLKPLALGALLLAAAQLQVLAQGSSLATFTYQGRLNTGNGLASGLYDFQFALFPASTGTNNQVDTTISSPSVPVSNGLFSVELSFPLATANFNGSDRWLEIALRPSLVGSNYVTLTPRQKITASPYAMQAASAGKVTGMNFNSNNSAVAFGINNTASGSYSTAMGVSTTASGDYSTAMGVGTVASGPFSTALGANSTASGGGAFAMGNGSTASGGDSVAMGGATTASGSFAAGMGYFAQALHDGTFVWADFSPSVPFPSTGTNQFLIRANGGVGINTNNPNGAALAVNGDMTVNGNFKGGYSGNIISNGVVGAFIGGGGDSTYPNIVGGSFASVLGGRNNTASGLESTAMGSGNKAKGAYATAMGSSTTASGDFSTALGAGTTASGYASISAGYQTTASGGESIAMGQFSTASGNSSTAMGFRATASADYAVAFGNEPTASGGGAIALGFRAKAIGVNSVAMGENTASGSESTAMGDHTIAGGTISTAMGGQTTANGDYSTAMGYRAQATNNGSFVWADFSSIESFSSTATNQFLLRASGGVGINTNNPGSYALAVAGTIGAINNTTEGFEVSGSAAGYALIDRSTGTRWSMYAAGNTLRFYFNGDRMTLGTNGLTVNGTFVSASDRNLKENFKPVDAQSVLAKVAALPLSEWNYKEDTGSRHLGPMAQDFYAAFGVGPDDKHIATIDESGVALAAIQGLNEKLEARSQKLAAENAQLQARNESLEARLSRLEQLLTQHAK